MADDFSKHSITHTHRRWRARRKRDGITYHLGYYFTREEAEERERQFDERRPSNRGKGLNNRG